MKVKEESEKAGLELNIQKTKIMASGPITSWQIMGCLLTASMPCPCPKPERIGALCKSNNVCVLILSYTAKEAAVKNI